MIELAIGAALVLAAVLATAWAERRRVARLAGATREVAGDPEKRLPIASAGGELRELALAINGLAEDAAANRGALARERTLLASVADGLTQGVIALDGDRKIEMLNDASRAMLGVEGRDSLPAGSAAAGRRGVVEGSLAGEPLLELVRVPALRALIERDGGGSDEIALPSGRRVLVRAVQSAGHLGCVLLLEDVTTVRRLETVRRDFIANVSHELRTPVAVIRANAETLMAGAANDPQIAPKLIDGLHRNAERLARILADLLDLSRLDAGQYRMELGPVPVKAITEQSLTAVETQAQARGVQVSVEIPDALVVRADPKALDQILVNLIDNAVKYTRADGHVWIEAREAGDAVRIEVRDDGPGIADKHRERVFERFYRADPSRSREAGGTGLGLSIVKHLVESMGGEVGVEPNAPRGSIFWLRLPCPTPTAMALG